jgi:hypothetical protein
LLTLQNKNPLFISKGCFKTPLLLLQNFIVYFNAVLGITESRKTGLRFYHYLSDFAIFQEDDSSCGFGVRVDQYLEHLGPGQRMYNLKNMKEK